MMLRVSAPFLRVNACLISRCASSMPAQSANVPHKSPDFKMVYRFPYIVGVKALCRVKLYQTGITTFLVPAAVVGHYNGLFPTTSVVTTVIANAIALTMLYIMGEFFRKFVGIVYVNERTKELKIAHLTFFGNRRDVVVPLTDVVPFSESEDNAADIYYKLKRYSTSDVFYMSFKFGGIVDRALLEKSLGYLQTDTK